MTTPANDGANPTPPANPAPAQDAPAAPPPADAPPMTEVEEEIAAYVEGVEGGLSEPYDPLAANQPEEKDDTKDEPGEVPPEEAPKTEGDKQGGGDGEVPGTPTDGEQSPAPATPQETPQPAPQLTDPGEFAPGDYGFEITTKDGTAHKIASLEDAQAFAATLDEAPENISASAFMDFNSKVARMTIGIEQDKAKYEANKAEFDAASSQQAESTKALEQISSGIDYLTKKGILPTVDPKYDTVEMGAKWNTPELKDQPGIKERLELLAFMTKENDIRREAGLEPSFDVLGAQTALELQQLKTKEAEVVDRQQRVQKDKGAMVGGATPYVQSSERPGVIVGSGGTLDDWAAENSNY